MDQPGVLSLNGIWGLAWAEGAGRIKPTHYTGQTVWGKPMLEARVPAPIHAVLGEAGLIEDPYIGLNSLKARWVEEMFWIYRRTFEAPAEACAQSAWITFKCLELDSTVWLNGEVIGRHANANRPARFEVTGKLHPGENLIVVQLDAGTFAHIDKPAGEYGVVEISQLVKRPFLRKPQYQCGWDWNPRLQNVGILGDVELEWHRAARLDQVTVIGIPSDDLSRATVQVRAIVEGVEGSPSDAVLRARILETNTEVDLPFTVKAGCQQVETRIELSEPRLWWPVNHGEQYRYTVEVTLETAGDHQTRVLKTGIRLVEVDQSPHPIEGRYFTVKINKVPVFWKGANWAPADMLYSAVDGARYRELIALAAQANFNAFRVNGVGLFVTHELAEACDEAGILLWHDFLFGCAKYPGDDPAFAAEVRREVTWAVRELAHHPSLVIWCGSNEIEWGDWAWRYDDAPRTHPHYALFHHDLPLIVRTEDPSKFYWPSSPFSPDQQHPNDSTVGDQHPWSVSFEVIGAADWWGYRHLTDRFSDEGGVLGASPLATLRQFLPEGERYLLSPSWEHHDNSIAYMERESGAPGRAYATVAYWSGRDPLEMEWTEYAFISALLQAEGLAEYAANYRRRMFSSAAAVFWSYNDSWPVTHGWTIVDYYLRQKLAYHTVRRAFQPVTTVVVEDQGVVQVYGINDSREAWSGDLRYGLFTLEGKLRLDQGGPIKLPANKATLLQQFARSEWESLGLNRSGAFAVLSQQGHLVAQHRLFLERFKNLEFSWPRIRMDLRDGKLTLESDCFVWAVCLDIEGDRAIPDNCFDLLPNIRYTVPWPEELGEPRIVRIGSRDVIQPILSHA